MTCPECNGVGSYATEWADLADDPNADELLEQVIFFPEPPDGTVILRCHVCGPLLLRVAAVNKMATDHEEVRMVLGGVCRRYEVTGVGDLAEKYPEEFELLEQAFINMIAELPHTKGYE